MDARLLEALERIEIAFKASKPFIQMSDALVLYKAILKLPPVLSELPPLYRELPPLE